MPPRRILHAITPGDHFSPRTGSAIPTVVDGIARAAMQAGAPRQAVVLDRSTYHPRYDSADVVEYTGVPGVSRAGRLTDAARGRLGLSRAAVARYFSPIANAVRDQPPGIVLAHNAPVLPWLLRGTQHAAVLYAHNDLLRTYTKTEAGRMLADAAAIVCVSESLADRTRDRLPRSLADVVHVVGNGVDADMFAPGATQAGSPPRIMFVGRVIAEKGVDVLLRAAARLDADAAEVVIVGRPGFAANAPLDDYEQRLRALADECACQVRFETFQTRPGLPALLRSADVFVVPSRWQEPSTLTVGEAFATGLPVVASRVGGIPEVVGDAGVLVAPDDPSALAEALQSLLADSGRRAALSAAARSRAVSHDWSWTWRQLEATLEAV